MKRIALLFALIFIFYSCAASYVVTDMGDEFSNPGGPAGRILRGNYIVFKDPLGLIANSQLNPYLFRDKKSNEIMECGFQLINVRNHNAYTNQKWLVIREGDEMIFLTDGERVVLKAKGTKIDHIVGKYNTVTKTHPIDYYDYAWYPCTIHQFKQIASSNNLKIRINGKEGIETYGVHRKLLDSFLPNLKMFMENELQ